MLHLNKILIAITAAAAMNVSYAVDYSASDLRNFVRMCKKDDAKSCEKLTEYYFRHENFDADVSEACEFAEKSCILGNLSDCPIATAEICHDPKTTDPAINLKYWELGCKGNDAESCVALALESKKVNEYVKTLELYEKACKIDRTEHRTKACSELEKLYNRGYGLQESPDKVKVIFRKACAQKMQKACRALSRITDSYY